MKLFKRFNLILFIILAALLAACGGGQPEALEPVEYTIVMTEYAFEPASLQLEAGQEVTLHLRNEGQLDHEITIGRDVREEDSRPTGYQVDLFEVAGVEPETTGGEVEEGEEGFVFIVPPGGEGTMVFPVTEEMAGEWEMGCFEQEGVHYDAGMHGPLSVSD